MAEIAQAVYARLAAYTTLTAIVDKRIYPGIAPQASAAPYLTYQQIPGTQRISVMGDDVTLRPSLFQFDAWAKTYLQSHQVMTAVEGALVRYTGNHASIELHEGFVEREPQDVYEDDAPQPADPTNRLYRVSMDIRIWWRPV